MLLSAPCTKPSSDSWDFRLVLRIRIQAFWKCRSRSNSGNLQRKKNIFNSRIILHKFGGVGSYSAEFPDQKYLKDTDLDPEAKLTRIRMNPDPHHQYNLGGELIQGDKHYDLVSSTGSNRTENKRDY